MRIEIRGKLVKHKFGLNPDVLDYLIKHCYAVIEEEILLEDQYPNWLAIYAGSPQDLTISRKKLILIQCTSTRLMAIREAIGKDIIIKDGYLEVKQ